MPSLEDMEAMKALAHAQRGASIDFADLFFRYRTRYRRYGPHVQQASARQTLAIDYVGSIFTTL